MLWIMEKHLKILSFDTGDSIVFQPIKKIRILHLSLWFKSFVTSFISMILPSAQYQESLIDFEKKVVKKEFSLLGDYLFCFNSKFEDQKFIKITLIFFNKIEH